MKCKRPFRIVLILVIFVFVIFQGFKLYLFSDSTPLVSSLTEKMGAKKVMIVFAHPDDESYTTQILTDAENESIETTLLTFTPGDAGTQMPEVCQQQFLGDIRKAEVLKSGFVLGVDHQKVYNYGDGTLTGLDIDTLVADILAELNLFQPDLVVTFWPESGMTGHPDHCTIGKATQLAVAKFKEEKKGINLKVAYTIMPPKVLTMLGNEAMNELQPKANYSVKAKAKIKTRLWKINASQQKFVKNYTGLPDWLLYRILNREYYFVEE